MSAHIEVVLWDDRVVADPQWDTWDDLENGTLELMDDEGDVVATYNVGRWVSARCVKDATPVVNQTTPTMIDWDIFENVGNCGVYGCGICRPA